MVAAAAAEPDAFAVSSRPASDAPLSIGDYFEAVRSFLEGTGREADRRLLESRGAKAAAAAILPHFSGQAR